MSNRIIEFFALAAFVYYPSIPLVLILAHRTLPFWRRLKTKSYYLLLTLFLVLDLAALLLILKFKDQILFWRLYNHPAALLGLILILSGVILGATSIRTLSFRTLVGVPELNPTEEKAKLVTRGIYRRLRHPRYLEFILEVLGFAVLSGLGANFLLFIYFLPLIILAAHSEEQELARRFGTEYEEYKKKIGGFLPKL